MHLNLEKEIEGMVKTLKDSEKVNLAKEIEQNWNKTALEYSKELNSWEPDGSMELELMEAFKEELQRLDFSLPSIKKILSSIEKQRILQTAPHLVPTEGPRMLCADWLGSLGVSKDKFYVVGMFSGIPFSNNFRPGRISGKKSEINLFSSLMQDALVYKSKIPAKLLEKFKSLPSQLKKMLPLPTLDDSYTKWAIQSCQNVQRKVLEKNNLVYLDINEVISNYLAQVLKDKNHIFYKMFFDSKTKEEFVKMFSNETIFYAPVQNGKYEEMENMFLSGTKIKSKNREILLDNPKILIREIKDGRLCPSLLLTYLTLVSLNRFKCFGSFAQVERFPAYQKKLANLSFMKKFQIRNLPISNLTVGAFLNETDLFPSDLIVENKKLIQNENYIFGELVIKMKDRLIENYSTSNE